MPSDDLVLNVRQVAGYSPTANAPPSSALLIQLGGIGGPYASISPQDLVSTALATAPVPGDAQDGQLFADGFSTPVDGWWMWNAYGSVNQPGAVRVANGPSAAIIFDGGWQFAFAAPGGAGAPIAWQFPFSILSNGYVSANQILLARDPVTPLEAATQQYVDGLRAFSVTSFNMRFGDIMLNRDDIICAGGAPIWSPYFNGEPRAPTPDLSSNSSLIATTAFVQGAIANVVAGGGLVASFNGRTGAVVLTADDVVAADPPYAPLASPAFSGVPTAPTAGAGNATGQLATTAFVQSAIAGGTAGVVSFNGRTGVVVLGSADISSAGGALLGSPAFSGVPTAPTPAPGTQTAQLATTAFVIANAGAPINSPAFTGTPTAPTAAPATNSTQLATTAYVTAAITASDVGVSSFNGRTGAVSLIANDISAAGGAVLASPAFTGVPTAPTAAPATNTTQIATTAFVEAAITSSPSGVATFNGRAGAVTLILNDVTAAGGAPIASPTFTGIVGIPGVTNGSSAPAGQVGESVIGAQGGGPLSTGAPASAGSLALSAGDWDVWARCNFVPGSNPTITAIQLGVSLTAATFNNLGDCGGSVLLQAAFTTGGTQTICTAPCRISLAAGGTAYAVAQCNFTTGGVTANAFLSARRAR